jgi:hypothetical protein
VHDNIKVLWLNVILHFYSLLHNKALPTAGTIMDRVGTMIAYGTYLGTFERDYHVQTEGNISATSLRAQEQEKIR